MKKFIIALFVQCAIVFCIFNALAAESAVYTNNFDTADAGSGIFFKNDNCYETDFVSAVAGKAKEDKSLAFSRKTDSSSNGIYTLVYSPVNLKYIKYEFNFMPNSDSVTEAGFKTGSDKWISPVLYCTDQGTGGHYVLERNRWNKIVFVITLGSTTVDKTSKEVLCSADLFVNGERIFKGAEYTLFKDSLTSSTVPLRFFINGTPKGEGDTALANLTAYIDDVDVRRYDAYPSINAVPYIVTDENAEIKGGECVLYSDGVTANSLTLSAGAFVTVYSDESFKTVLSNDSALCGGNVIVAEDAYKQIKYYTVRLAEVNSPEIEILHERAYASANLKDAVMVLAGYLSDGALGSAQMTNVQGKAYLELNGEFSSAKVFLLKSLESLEPIAAKEKKLKPMVACWGDSLTEGDGSSDFRKGGTRSYPGVLKTLTGYDVRNMGTAGESAITIAARQGGLNILTEKEFTIPKDCETAAEIEFKAYNDDQSYAGTVVPKSQKDWNPCVINGVEGTLTTKVVKNEKNQSILEWAKFKRSEPGDEVTVPKGTKIFLPNNSYVLQNADINIIFTGTNGVWNASGTSGEAYADDLVILIKKMLAKTKNPDKYIIIGLTTRTKEDWKNTDAKLKEAFGEHLILPRERLATEEVLTDNGITPTGQDKKDIAVGRVPTSLRKASNDVHFNDTGYYEIAKLVYEKMQYLGYCG